MVKKLFKLLLILFTITAFPTYAFEVVESLVGEWKVVSIGSDCNSTSWIESEYEPKQGKIIGTKIIFKKDRLNWGKLSCVSIKYKLAKEDLMFSDGSSCRTNPAVLPKECITLMNNLHGKKVLSFEVTCKESKLVPVYYVLLSVNYALATVDGEFICLKRTLIP